jgi:hypothetical protein
VISPAGVQKEERMLSSYDSAHVSPGDFSGGKPQCAPLSEVLAKGLLRPFWTSLGVDVVVVTTDYRVVMGRRSSKVAVLKRAVFVPSETMSPFDTDAAGAPNIYKTAQRGMEEEIGLKLEADELEAVRFCLFGISRANFGGALVCVVFLGDKTVHPEHRISSEEWKYHSNPGLTFPKDNWEAPELFFPTIQEFSLIFPELIRGAIRPELA